METSGEIGDAVKVIVNPKRKILSFTNFFFLWNPKGCILGKNVFAAVILCNDKGLTSGQNPHKMIITVCYIPSL